MDYEGHSKLDYWRNRMQENNLLKLINQKKKLIILKALEMKVEKTLLQKVK